MPHRDFDVVLLGATGFVGRLTARYLAARSGERLRWALAGRDPDRLADVRRALGPDCAELPLLHADVDDPPSVEATAAATRVLITTVGPYQRFGEPAVAACAATGTDYLDLTGEPEFVDDMYLRHHDRAAATGARIVHACGFDSVPADLGAYYTVGELPDTAPITVRGYVRFKAAVSGGTFASALNAFSRPRQTAAAHRRRNAAEPRDADGRRARAVPGRPHAEPGIGWALPLPTIDPQIVARSARALSRYGPDFRYSHFGAFDTPWTAAAGAAAAAGLFGAAQLPPLRKALVSRLPAGSGPSEERRARSRFSVTFVGEGGGERVVTRVSGGDPGYDETAKMLGEAALCLIQDELPAASGQVTPAVAFGDALVRRLQRAGIRFERL